MKYTIYVVALLLLLNACRTTPPFAANPYATQSDGKPMLLGRHDPTLLTKDSFASWYNRFYASYKTDSNLIASLSQDLKGKKITVFYGTWCGDSKREVPHLLKLLAACGFDNKHLQLVGVDRTETAYKQSPQHEEAGKQIFRVPTIIVSAKGRELGRIIESPKESLEKDLHKILTGAAYAPGYHVGWNYVKQMEANEIAAATRYLQENKAALEGGHELNTIGYFFLYKKATAAAIHTFEQNLLLFPGIPNLMNSLAEAYITKQEMTKAKALLEKVLEKDAANAEALRLKKLTE
jgi:thiol-disulfide isomerase/thioredoxin